MRAVARRVLALRVGPGGGGGRPPASGGGGGLGGAALKKLAEDRASLLPAQVHVESQEVLVFAHCATSGPTDALRWSCEVSPRSPTLVQQNIAGASDLLPL